MQWLGSLGWDLLGGSSGLGWSRESIVHLWLDTGQLGGSALRSWFAVGWDNGTDWSTCVSLANRLDWTCGWAGVWEREREKKKCKVFWSSSSKLVPLHFWILLTKACLRVAQNQGMRSIESWWEGLCEIPEQRVNVGLGWGWGTGVILSTYHWENMGNGSRWSRFPKQKEQNEWSPLKTPKRLKVHVFEK